MQIIVNKKEVNVVAANQLSALSKTWMGKFSTASFYMFYEAAKKYRDGNNIHCLQGSASIIRKKFAKSLNIPEDTSVDQGFLYVSATQKNRKGFSFAHNTRIIFNPISSFKDWRILGLRTLASDKQNLGKLFGRKILSEYNMPKKLIYESILKCFFRNPFETAGAIIMNFYIRKFPLVTNKAFKSTGIWEIVSSSKEAIRI